MPTAATLGPSAFSPTGDLVRAVGSDPRNPICFVLIAMPSSQLWSGDREIFGPFISEEDATNWAVEQLPERVLFEIAPVLGAVIP